MPVVIFKAFSRHLTQHPWQLGLALLGIVVGVAVVVAIRMTQMSATDAFDAATRTIAGPANHRLIGSNGYLSHTTYRALRDAFPQIRVTPVMRRSVTLPDHGNRRAVLLGIEPVSRADLATGDRREPVLFDPGELIAEPFAALLNSATARALNLARGARLAITFEDKRADVHIIEILPGANTPGGVLDDFIVVDIATAQEALQIYDAVDYLDLIIDRAIDVSELRAALARGGLVAGAESVELIDLAEESMSIKRMTDAFYANLTALSLMALLVGMFLIYNTETFLVIQRREVFGRLRALGVSRAQCLGVTLAEAAVIGAIGSAGGIVVGIVLADRLLGIVAATVNDLYFETSAQALALTPATLFLGFGVGVLATIAAALVPAVHATRVEPNVVIARSGVRPHSMRSLVRLALTVFVLCNALAWIVLVSAHGAEAGFAGICLVVVGFAALCPVLIVVFASAVGTLVGAGRAPERLGFATVRSSINRTGTAAAALMIATAASIGIGIMVTSFRVSVSDWLDSTLRADLYLADGRFDNHASGKKITAQIVERIARLPAVDSISTVLRQEVGSSHGRVRLAAFKLNDKARRGFRFKAGDAATIWREWEAHDLALVTEPFAYRHKIKVGDVLQLNTVGGERPFTVVGIYLDYASERGSVSVSRTTYERHWAKAGVDGIGVYGTTHTGANELGAAIKSALGADSTLVINSSADLKRTSLAVFDRTFLITELLRSIALAVSFIGVLGALLAQQLERTREYGILRAIGFTDVEMARNVLSQTLLLGFTAALIAIPVGLIIALILIDVVNPRSFGWTMTFLVPPMLVAKSCSVALLAAFAAGLYPSFRAARIEPADAMRYE